MWTQGGRKGRMGQTGRVGLTYIHCCLVAQSCLALCNSMVCQWDSPGKNTGMGCHSLLQGLFPTQGSNPGQLHCRQILYHLSHQGSPRILEWVAFPLSRDLPDPGIEPGSPALQADSLPAELPGKPISVIVLHYSR